MAKYLLSEFKQYDGRLGDLFIDYEGNKYIYNSDNDNITALDGSEVAYLGDLIGEHCDSSFIYYSEANDYLRDYNIFVEIREFQQEFGTTPDNECILATGLYEREIGDCFYDALKGANEYEEQ